MAAVSSARRSMSSPAFPQPLRPSIPQPQRASGRSDVFKPRLPLDPFSSIDYKRHNPIVIPAEKLLSAAAAEPRRDVILVLGGAFLYLYLVRSVLDLDPGQTGVRNLRRPCCYILMQRRPRRRRHVRSVRCAIDAVAAPQGFLSGISMIIAHRASR